MNKQLGFTLTELLIVVTIIALLAAIGYPSYQSSVRKGKRSECIGALTELQNQMERFFTVNSTYLGAADAGANTGAPAVGSATCPTDGGTATYNLTISAATAATYTLSATPTGAQASDKCGTLTLTNRGVKGVTGAATGQTWQTCWR